MKRYAACLTVVLSLGLLSACAGPAPFRFENQLTVFNNPLQAGNPQAHLAVGETYYRLEGTTSEERRQIELVNDHLTAGRLDPDPTGFGTVEGSSGLPQLPTCAVVLCGQ